MDQRQHWNPAAHQYFPGSHPPVGPPPPPAPRRTGLLVGLVVTAVIAIGATTTAIVVGTSHGTAGTASPALAALPSGGLPSAVPSRTDGGAPTAASPPAERTNPPSADPGVVTGDDDRENSGGVPDNGSDPGDLGGGDTGGDPRGDTGGDAGGSGGGDRPQGSAQSQRNDILQSALAWIDARNSGDGERTLQLGCSDDVSAVQSGQPNPAAYAGYTAFRPTGEVIGHSSGLAAYVVISSQNLQTGATQPSRLPIVWEQGAWRMCYYPGAETNRITGG